ncbi:MAG: response regulator [Myxococcota bacterium]
MTGLVVEDSPTQAEALTLLLESEGYTVVRAPDGADALARLAAAPEPDIAFVVSDIVMPRMDGYALCRAMRVHPALADVPVLLLTSRDDPFDVIRALEAGANGFMHKPYEPERLLERVRCLVEVGAARMRGELARQREFLFRGRTVDVTASREQVCDLFLCTLDELLHVNDVLRANEASLEATNRELESFSYSISHDLRAPLRAIDGFSRAVLDEHGDTLAPEAQAHLERVSHAAARMTRLIEALLELARVARTSLRRGPVDLSRLAGEVVHDLRQAEPERAPTVRIAEGLRVSGDAALLRALLVNLLSNAWKFTSRRPDPLIEVGAEERGGEPVYFVRDNGAGFDMALAGRLFTPFQRLHREADFPGTGVGLATVQRIAHRHGGKVWAEGAPGQGATFYFTLG